MPQTTCPEITTVDRAQNALSHSPIYALRHLRVDATEAELHITGRVESFYHKQLAQESVRAVAAGLRVVNTVNVEGN